MSFKSRDLSGDSMIEFIFKSPEVRMSLKIWFVKYSKISCQRVHGHGGPWFFVCSSVKKILLGNKRFSVSISLGKHFWKIHNYWLGGLVSKFPQTHDFFRKLSQIFVKIQDMIENIHKILKGSPFFYSKNLNRGSLR